MIAKGKQDAEEAAAEEMEVNLTYFKKWSKGEFPNIDDYNTFKAD
jgi:hypothetical protein